MSTADSAHDHSHDVHIPGIDCGHDHSGGGHHHHHDDGESRPLDIKILSCLLGGVLLIAAVFAKYLFHSDIQSDILGAIASILLGTPIIVDALRELIPRITGKGEAHHSHMEELVAIAIIASFADGQFLECGTVAFFMLIASFIEHRTAVGAKKTIESLIRITPTKAHRIADTGEEELVEAKDLAAGDRVRIRPGDNIPGDGKILKGQSTIDQANITGESVPVEKSDGDEVFSGTINQTGVLEVEISRAGKDSTLGKVQDLIVQAAQTRPAVVRLLDQYAAYYTPVVLMITAMVLYFTQDMKLAIGVLLISCPCAIILAGPTAIVSALSAAARLGVYIKSVTDLEVARRVSAFVLDKTGTLTVGKLSVTRMQPVDGFDPAELLKLCASAEQNSKHPVARAVVDVANKAKIKLRDCSKFEEIPGRGVTARIIDQDVLVGRQAWIEEQGVSTDAADLTGSDGLSLLFVAVEGKLAGWVGLADEVRKGAAEAMDQLKEQGVKRLVMITGDRLSPARRVAAAVHVTDLDAEALPGDKLALVKQLKEAGHTVAVVGDGVNDGPALAAGDISIAMGAAGSDVAIHSASCALMNNNLNRIPFLPQLSRRTVTVIRQNLAGVLIYVIGMLALFAWMRSAGFRDAIPIVAAISHGVSSILVVFNSARLFREGEQIEDHVAVEDNQRRIRTESVAPTSGTGTSPDAPASA